MPRLRDMRPGGQILGWGIGWAVLLTLSESLALPPEFLHSRLLLAWWLFGYMTPYWCVLGSVLVWLSALADRHAGTRGVIGAWLLVSALSVMVYPWVHLLVETMLRAHAPAVAAYMAILVPDTPEAANTLRGFHVWVCLFYGGLLVIAHTLAARTDRMRALLHRDALLRGQVESRIATARSAELEALLDPQLLLRTLRELEALYRRAGTDPALFEDADRLLDALVELLRCSMPVVRGEMLTPQVRSLSEAALARLQLARRAQPA